MASNQIFPKSFLNTSSAVVDNLQVNQSNINGNINVSGNINGNINSVNISCLNTTTSNLSVNFIQYKNVNYSIGIRAGILTGSFSQGINLTGINTGLQIGYNTSVPTPTYNPYYALNGISPHNSGFTYGQTDFVCWGASAIPNGFFFYTVNSTTSKIIGTITDASGFSGNAVYVNSVNGNSLNINGNSNLNGNLNITSGNIFLNGNAFSGGGGSSQWTTSASNIYYNTGNVSIGKTTSVSALDISGITTSVSFNSTSDRRIKQNLVDICLNEYKIDNLKPYLYTNLLSNQLDFGVIADELQNTSFNFLVNGKPNDIFPDSGDPKYQSVNYQSLIPVLIKEIQEIKTILKNNNII
jgi:hypothetical protein